MKTNDHFWKKVGLLCLCYWGMLLWEGCSATITDSCAGQGCPIVEFPYYDYEQVSIEENQTSLAPGDPLFLTLFPRDLNYIACQRPLQPSYLGLLNRAYACSCVGNGFRGDKFPLEAITIYADKPFKEGRPKDAPLNEYFSVVWQSDGGERVVPLNEVSSNSAVRLNGNIRIQGTERPDQVEESYVLTVELLKSNGEKVLVDTQPLRWLP